MIWRSIDALDEDIAPSVLPKDDEISRCLPVIENQPIKFFFLIFTSYYIFSYQTRNLVQFGKLLEIVRVDST